MAILFHGMYSASVCDSQTEKNIVWEDLLQAIILDLELRSLIKHKKTGMG